MQSSTPGVPYWVPILVAAVGLLTTLAGVAYTQWRSDKRERQTWNRQREREREQWAREDTARSYDHRQQAYVAFAAQWEKHYDRAWRHREFRLNEPDPDYDWADELVEAYAAVELFGTRSVFETALAAIVELNEYINSGNRPHDRSIYEQFISEVRRDLSIPDAPPSQSSLP